MRLSRKTLSKADLAKYVEKELKCSRRISVRLVNGIFNLIKENIEAGNRVQLSAFGTFEVKHRAGHRGKNPKTGETFLVKAQRIALFRPGKALKNLRSNE